MSNFRIESLQESKAILAYTSKLASPIVIEDMLYCVAENGDILRVNEKGQTDVVFTILGQPSSLTIKTSQNVFLISDFAHQTVFSREQSNNYQIHNLVMQYDNHAFLGPNSLKVGPFTKNIYFTDSGPFQQTSIQNQMGSVFVIRGQSNKLKCLSFRNLAYPTGLEVDDQQKYLLVCQMGQNRILRFILDQNISGSYSVFHQFNGRFGPSAICCYDSKFYVSLFEFQDLGRKGQVAVLNSNGQILQKLLLQVGPQISGICIYQQGSGRQEEVMLVSQGSTVYRIPLKKEEESKMSESIVLSKS